MHIGVVSIDYFPYKDTQNYQTNQIIFYTNNFYSKLGSRDSQSTISIDIAVNSINTD